MMPFSRQRPTYTGIGTSEREADRIARRIARIRDSWDEETAYFRAHGTHLRRPLEIRRCRVMPRGRRAPLHSTVGGGFDQEDMSFQHALYLMDHGGE